MNIFHDKTFIVVSNGCPSRMYEADKIKLWLQLNRVNVDDQVFDIRSNLITVFPERDIIIFVSCAFNRPLHQNTITFLESIDKISIKR